ncbi:MAG: ABC transporter permease subunit [Spirochaetales bacterium]|nr:ABC transporter permease subunit [Spirochaetales bacterium]
MFKSSPETTRRIKRFFKIKRAIVSLFILIILYVISFFSELIANDKPILIQYNGKLYFFAAYNLYPDKTFGGNYDTETQYRELSKTDRFTSTKGNFILFPPIPYSPYTSNLNELTKNPPTPPDGRHLLGTDDRGRDVFARLLYGFRVSMSFAIILLIIEIIIGVIIGALQGYSGGFFDLTAQRFIEILSALPFLYIIILTGNIFGQGFNTLIIVMSIFNWIGLSYYIRAEFLRIKKFQFVDAAKLLGTGDIKILFSEILPNALVPIITFAPFSLIAAIQTLSALDYLGFGLPAPTPSWGELMRQGMEHLSSFWLSVYPFIALFLTLLLLAFVGEGLREAMDPKEYARME